MINKTFKLHK